MKTVFFGPFIGEFGWELVYWQGWVKEVSKTIFKDCYKIVSSYPGRYPFYPYADEFWPHTQEFTSILVSQRDYITDYWKNGLPKGNITVKKYRFGLYPYYKVIPYTTNEPRIDISNIVYTMLCSYKERLPEDTLYFMPFTLNKCPKYNIIFGTTIKANPIKDADFVTKKIDLKYQALEKISSTKKGKDFLNKIVNKKNNLIAIFPRRRSVRRPDKNWAKDKYIKLIELLKNFLNGEYTIALLGEPGGAYFDDTPLEDCLDLINISSEIRLDTQIAFLERADLAIGGMSGAILFALACGCPALTFGFEEQRERYYQENYLNTRFIYYPDINPEPEEIFDLAIGMLSKKIPPANQKSWNPLDYFNSKFKIKKFFRSYFVERIINFTL